MEGGGQGGSKGEEIKKGQAKHGDLWRKEEAFGSAQKKGSHYGGGKKQGSKKENANWATERHSYRISSPRRGKLRIHGNKK